MAVVPMKSVTVVGHAAVRSEVLAAIHRFGAMQLTDVNGSLDGAGEPAAAACNRIRKEWREHARGDRPQAR